MEIFVDTPHLPQGRVRKLILGEKYKNVLNMPLISLNIEPIWLKCNDSVDKRLSGHCDLMAVHLGNDILAVQDGTTADCDFFDNMDVIKVEKPISSNYPFDAHLNICIVGEYLIYNPKSADSRVSGLINKVKLTCRQGYTKCSIAVVDERSIITSDRKIAAIASAAGLDVLLVREDITALDGFEHGFIGGASFKISRSIMAFTGIVDDENEKNKIERFLSDRGITALYLTKLKLFDIGSAIPITEENQAVDPALN